MPQTNGSIESARGAAAHGRHSDSRKRLIRLMVPLLFLIPMVAVVFAVMTILKDRSAAPSANPPPRVSSGVSDPEQSRLGTAGDSGQEPVPVLPVPTPPVPEIVQPPPDLPPGMEAVDPSSAAYEVLEKFLAASSLAERLPLMETRTTEPELAKSCLANPLPASSNIYPVFRETNAVEQVIDFYYNLDFDAGGNKLDHHTILVRKRGGTDPRVVADPFLDSYGGRLAAYASTPSEKAGIFQVIVYAVASCNDKNIPNSEKKLTLKLLPQDSDKVSEIARATFGRQSKIGLMLADGTYDLSFGKARACTVMLRWNHEDRPDMPYLEAIDIKALDWNP